MILAVGLSPAWQQIVVLDRLEAGEVNRAREVHWCASGKAVNVALALHALGKTPPPPLRKGGPGGSAPQPFEGPPTELDTAKTPNVERRTSNAQSGAGRFSSCGLALVGGFTGEAIRHEFGELGVPARWVHSSTPTRVCTTILDQARGVTTELVEQAGAIQAADLMRFREAFGEEAKHAQAVVLTGSLPEGAPATLYREMMGHTSARVILDCQGAPLLAALEARPFVVKPNREELGRTLGRPVASDGELHAAMRELSARGAEWVVVSQGKRPVWIGSATELLSIEPPVMEVVNPIGSGDCLAAGIAIGLTAGYDLPDAVAFGVAAAAENVRHLLPARLDPTAVNELWQLLRP